jgi:hypothetical protein
VRKLPIQQTINHMLSSTFNNLGFALKAQWPWFVLLAVALSLLGSVFGFEFWGDQAATIKYFEDNPGMIFVSFVSFFGMFLLAFLAFSSCAVNWHRYVLLDEVPQTISAMLRVDATVWRYFGNLILIGLILIPLILPLMVISVPLVPENIAMFGLLALAYVTFVISPILYRLSIKLPAIALGRQDFRMGDAWNSSRDNWWQFVGVGAIFSVISWGVGLVLALVSSLLQNMFGPVFGFGVDMLIQTGVNWILTVMGITLLTSLYGFFVEKRDF